MPPGGGTQVLLLKAFMGGTNYTHTHIHTKQTLQERNKERKPCEVRPQIIPVLEKDYSTSGHAKHPPRNSGRAVGLSGPQFPSSYLIPGFSHGLVIFRLCLRSSSNANTFTLSHLVSSATTCWKTDPGTSTAWCATPASWPLPTPRNVSVPPFHRTTVSLKRISDGLTVPQMCAGCIIK